MPKVTFTYSVQHAAGVQMHGQKAYVDIPDDVKLGYAELADAEANFLNWFREKHPGGKLLTWVSGNPEGTARYSEYQAFLPTNGIGG